MVDKIVDGIRLDRMIIQSFQTGRTGKQDVMTVFQKQVQQDPDGPESAGRATEAFFETYGLRMLGSIRRIIHAVDVHSRRLNSKHRITEPQMICLYWISRHGPLTISALAAKADLGASTIIGIIDRLEDKGLATRRRCRQDRRKVFIEATEQGAELTSKIPMMFEDQLLQSFSRLNPQEMEELAVALDKVAQLISPGLKTPDKGVFLETKMPISGDEIENKRKDES
jgi:DNA-binding MarR family transcriptional regulator